MIIERNGVTYELTGRELYLAYKEQEKIFDIEDIVGELITIFDNYSAGVEAGDLEDDYDIEQYRICKRLLNDSSALEFAAAEKRRMIDFSSMSWESATNTAVLHLIEDETDIDITSEIVECWDEMLVDSDGVNVTYELYVDADEYFGEDLPDDVWINFYTTYSGDHNITAKYTVNGDHSCVEKDWPLTYKEQDFFLKKMSDYCEKLYGCGMDKLMEEEA